MTARQLAVLLGTWADPLTDGWDWRVWLVDGVDGVAALLLLMGGLGFCRRDVAG